MLLVIKKEAEPKKLCQKNGDNRENGISSVTQ
jgi:hypothetical protein